jgi:hypothetical protein
LLSSVSSMITKPLELPRFFFDTILCHPYDPPP